MTLRCAECKKDVAGFVDPGDKWAELFTVVELLETEEAITAQTANLLREKLQWLSPSSIRFHNLAQSAERAGDEAAGICPECKRPIE